MFAYEHTRQLAGVTRRGRVSRTEGETYEEQNGVRTSTIGQQTTVEDIKEQCPCGTWVAQADSKGHCCEKKPCAKLETATAEKPHAHPDTKTA